MIFEHIETLKKQFTDKYVVVDDSRPELQRFRGLTGSVKTVNMSGRALVEFDGYNNIGWYDIDPSFLKVVDAPLPKPEAKEGKKEKAAPKAEKPAAPKAEKPAAALKPAAGKSVADILAAARKPASAAGAAPAAEVKPAPAAAKPAPGGKGMSMEDILAAARGKKPAGTAPAAKAETAPPAPAKPAPAPVAEKPAAAPTPARVAPGGKGMSMEDILAAARGKKPAGAAPAAKAEATPATPVQESAPDAEEPVAQQASAEPAAGGKKSLKDQITMVAEQLAYCHKVDSKSS